MEFSNNAVDITALPRAESVSLQPIERSYWRVLQLEWLIVAALFLAAGSALIYFIHPLQKAWLVSTAGGAWLIVTAVSYWLIQRSFARKAYAVREKDVLYRTGWIVRRLHVCPFNRIQHCSVHAGPIERKYGLASISVFTAGSEGSDLKIPGLTEETASAIREFIMQKVRTDEQGAD